MQIEKLAETLYKFTLSLSDQPDTFTVNLAACVGQDGILLIDTGWPQTAQELNEKVRELGDGNVKLIIITHPHLDHYGGNAIFGKEATLIAHKNAQDELSGKYFALGKLTAQELPTIDVKDTLSIRFNGQAIKIISAPGHTHSDMVVYFVDSGVVCLGDLVLADRLPPLDLARGGNAEHYIASMEKLTTLFPPDVKFITGHGRDYTLDDLRAHHQMAADTTELIKKGIAEGKNAQEMIEQDLLKDWKKWDSSQVTIETWITQVYENLLGQTKKSIAEPLTHTIVGKGIDAAIKQYTELKNTQAESYNFGENDLNMLGYQLMWRNMHEAAIKVHKLNTQINPQSANPYDSLGETYMASGNKELAIESYEKALAIDSNLPSAIDALKTLRSQRE
ncbi:MAG: MBL fold metallo-hydrolase [Chloroflexi bacterium]|nr:MBL fold metallo-hydrolase [Chloroflexota bacterium]